jgi:hypothetical protein
MKAQVPPSVNLDQFNELYIDERRAIVAKYPNGDRSTQGLYATNLGFSYDSQSWVPPVHVSSVDIRLQSPTLDDTSFSTYQLGLGGGASVFNLPRNFWNTASPPYDVNYAVRSGLTVKNGALPHLSNRAILPLVFCILFMVVFGVVGYSK